MQLTTVKELFKERDKYLTRRFRSADGSAASVIPKRSVLSY